MRSSTTLAITALCLCACRTEDRPTALGAAPEAARAIAAPTATATQAPAAGPAPAVEVPTIAGQPEPIGHGSAPHEAFQPEAGLDGREMGPWIGLLGPPDVPATAEPQR